jgi:hypothetical protein
MKRLFLLSASFALLRLTGSAAPCTNGSLASYVALGPTGCTLGSLTVFNFAYNANASGGAPIVTSDQITVTPLLAPAGNVALQLTASWGVLTGQGQTSKITYNLLAPGLGGQIQQVRLDGNGFVGGMFSSATVSEAVNTQVLGYDLQVFLDCVEVCRSQTSASRNILGLGILAVSDKVILQSKMGATALTGFADWFVVCTPCVQ